MYLKKFLSLRLVYRLVRRSSATAYPIFAQQNYKAPREANGRIVCANCHLAQKPVEIEVPQAVFPEIVFETTVKIPYDLGAKQVLGNGKLGDLNVGAVLVLPDSFQLAPPDRLTTQIKAQKLYFQPYSREQKNILVIGPVPGNTYQEMSFPIVAPNPNVEKTVRYNKYPVYVGGNRGRGQVYPDGSKSNNSVYASSTTGIVKNILPVEKKGGFQIFIETIDGSAVTEIIPPGPKLLVEVGQNIRAEDPLTKNPNVGGFGQAEAEIVLQNPERILGLFVFFIAVFVTQVFLVLKKKQFEKVQLTEMNF
jgi:apocytochrome f